MVKAVRSGWGAESAHVCAVNVMVRMAQRHPQILTCLVTVDQIGLIKVLLPISGCFGWRQDDTSGYHQAN